MYSLLPSMMTGIAQVDAEHQDLVGAINRIESAEKDGSVPEILKCLREFRDDLAGHFSDEEHYLRILGYPATDSHARHHAEIIAALERQTAALSDGGIEPGTIAQDCFSELLGAVFTMDMRFLDWRAEQKLRAGRKDG